MFEYAYHDGVPMAILTDGREWNFFLPGEQGAYDERRVYKLDIVERDVKECVESLCGFKPGPDMVATYLKESVAARATPPAPAARPLAQPAQRTTPAPIPVAAKAVESPTYAPAPRAELTRRAAKPYGQTGFSFEGQFHPARNAIDTLRQVFDLFIKRDPTFGERFAGLPKHGRSRRYLACDVANVARGRDLVDSLGD